MKSKPPRDRAASVRQRFLNVAKERGEEFNFVLLRYGPERLLFRLGQSPYTGIFVLKGAMLFPLWSGSPHRATNDMDLLGSGPPDIAHFVDIFREVAAAGVDDGVRFLPDTVAGVAIREDAIYDGIRITLEGRLGVARIPLQVDVGFGDAVTPAPVETSCPVLLADTNVAGFFHMTQEALRLMAPAKRGHIVNIGTSLFGQPVAGVPSALAILTKGGIEAATRSLAIEYAPLGIRVNTISAGIIDTPMHPPQNHEFLRRLSPMQRMGTTAEMADAVLLLEGASFVSGEILHLDGGAHAGKWS